MASFVRCPGSHDWDRIGILSQLCRGSPFRLAATLLALSSSAAVAACTSLLGDFATGQGDGGSGSPGDDGAPIDGADATLPGADGGDANRSDATQGNDATDGAASGDTALEGDAAQGNDATDGA